jgi:hypothetical protein
MQQGMLTFTSAEVEKAHSMVFRVESGNVNSPRSGPQNSDPFVRIESRILTAVAEVDEVGRGVIEKAVGIRLDLEVLHQSEGLALENPQMAIEAGHKQLVEVAAQEQRVLSVLKSSKKSMAALAGAASAGGLTSNGVLLSSRATRTRRAS